MTSSSLLAIDVDSTIYNPQDLYDRAAMDLFGEPFFYKGRQEWYEQEQLRERFGEDYQNIFKEALSPKYFEERELYPGVKETIEHLKEKGVKVHFVTHNIIPTIRDPLGRWLKGHFGPGTGLSITTVEDKGSILKRIGAFGLVDDAPKYLNMAKDLDIEVIVREQPWNREFRKENPHLFSFSEWEDLKNYLDGVFPGPLELEVSV